MGFLEKIAEITGQTQHEGVQCESARVFVQIVLLNKSFFLSFLFHFFFSFFHFSILIFFFFKKKKKKR